MTQTDVWKAFQSLPPKQKLAVARKIQNQMSDELFEELDKSLPNLELSEADIMNEVKAVRNATSKTN